MWQFLKTLEIWKNTWKSKKKSAKDDKDTDDEDISFEDLTDEEKDARDYQLQRAMEMVIAMDAMKSRSITSPTDIKVEKEKD